MSHPLEVFREEAGCRSLLGPFVGCWAWLRWRWNRLRSDFMVAGRWTHI